MTLKHRGICRIGYVRLGLSDLDKAAEFYAGILGLVQSSRTPDRLTYRCWHETHLHSLVIDRNERNQLLEVGFQVRDEEDLRSLTERVIANGVEVTTADADQILPGLGASIAFTIPGGLRLRLFAGMTQLGYLSGQHAPDWVTPKVVRGTPAPMFLNHVGITSDMPEKTVGFLADVLHFCISEKIISETSGQLSSALLFRMSKNVGGQEIAVFNGEPGRLHHIAFTKDDASDILVDGQYLRADGVTIDIEGPTRQPYGNTFSLHFRDPNGIRLELCSGGRMTEPHPDFQPVIWHEANANCAYAYYDEALDTDFFAASL